MLKGQGKEIRLVLGHQVGFCDGKDEHPGKVAHQKEEKHAVGPRPQNGTDGTLKDLDVVASPHGSPNVGEDNGQGGGFDAATGRARRRPDEHQHKQKEQHGHPHRSNVDSVEATRSCDTLEHRGGELAKPRHPLHRTMPF